MADKRMGDDFAASDGKRDLAIVMLTDAARKEFRRMREEATKEHDDLCKRQDERRERDIEAAKREINVERPKFVLVPPWAQRSRSLKASDVQRLAEHRVDTRNIKEVRDQLHAQRQREDDFLSKQKEGRFLREGADRSRDRDRDPRRDFDKARDPDRGR